MSTRAWVPYLTLFGIAGLLVYVFGRTQVAPCLAGPAPDIQAACYENWLETRGILLQLLDSPIPGIALFLLLTGTTWLLTRQRPIGGTDRA